MAFTGSMRWRTRRGTEIRVLTPSGSRSKVEQVVPVDGVRGFSGADGVRLETLSAWLSEAR
jgi:hypothetical protein